MVYIRQTSANQNSMRQWVQEQKQEYEEEDEEE
jgi:hypothetical protein